MAEILDEDPISTKPSHDNRFRAIIQKLASRFARLRANRGDSMEKVARACGITRGTVFKTENPGDHEDLSLATIWSIARHHGLTLEDVFKSLEPRTTTSIAELIPSSPHLEKVDELALSLVSEVAALQFRADLAEAACLVAKDDEQLEVLSKHSSKLRLKRYQLLIKQRDTDGSGKPGT